MSWRYVVELAVCALAGAAFSLFVGWVVRKLTHRTDAGHGGQQ